MNLSSRDRFLFLWHLVCQYQRYGLDSCLFLQEQMVCWRPEDTHWQLNNYTGRLSYSFYVKLCA